MSEDWDAGVADFLKAPELTPGTPPVVPPTAPLKFAMSQAVDTKPDYEAELRRAAVATGVPLDTARNDPKAVLDQHKALALNLDGLAETSPATASFLTDGANAKVAHDDIGALSTVEQTLKNLGNLGKAAFFATASGSAGALQAMAPALRAIGIHPPLGGEFDDPTSEMGKGLTALRKGSKAAADAFTPQVDNPWAQGLNNGIVNIFQFAPITAGAVITKNPGIALGAMGALSGGEAYGEAKDTGKTDAQARRYAGVQGAIAMLAQAIPLGKLFEDTGAGKTLAHTVAANVLREAPAMQAQTLASDFDRWVELHPDKPVSEFLKERGPAAISTLVQGAVGSVGNATVAHLGGLASNDGSNAAKAVQAQQHAVILGDLMTAAKASKLRDRDPASFQDFVAQATKDGPVEHVYIDPQRITDVLAQGDPEKLTEDSALLRAMPSVLPQMDEALRTGQDVQIPMSEFATWAAGSHFAQELLPHLKTDPNDMTLAESQAFLQDHAEELKAKVQEIMKEADAEDANAISAGKVKDAVLGQLTEANRFTPDVNEAYSTLTAAFYKTLAHRLGITPEEAYAQHPVQIAAQDVSGGAKLDQPVYHGTPHAFDAFSLDHIGSGEGAQVYGHGLYFAGNKEVAEYYRDALGGEVLRVGGRELAPSELNGADRQAYYQLKSAKWDIDRAIERASAAMNADEVQDRLRQWKAVGVEREGKGRLYHVDIPGDEHFLDWDKPLRQQPEGVQGVLRDLGIDIPEPPKLEDVKSAAERNILRAALKASRDPDTGELPEDVLDHVGLVIDNDRSLHNRVLDLAKMRGHSAEDVTDNGVGRYFTRLPDVWDHLNALTERTGEHAYKELAADAGTTAGDPAAASDMLRKAGIAGIRYLDGASRDEGEGHHNYVLFDADLAKISHFEQNKGEKAPRGSFDPNTNLISLLKGADLSTYLHESGHFYLETLARVAASHPENAELNADMATALKFMSQKDMTPAEWLAQPLDARREGHERFARGFEAYLMEGKAPTAELRGVFQRFRSWLVSVYKSLAGLKVELTPDVREVYARMLAAQHEIENNEAAQGYAPLFKNAADAGMTPQEFEAYQRLGADATASAVDQLETRSIRDMKWLSGAKDRKVRELQAEAATRRKAMRGEVTAEVMAEPINRARTLLSRGMLDGQEVEGPTKLSLPDLRTMYGEDGDYRKLGYGKYGMLAEDGLPPDHVAELLGFSSGDELVRRLLSDEPAKAKIEGLTDQRMLERYGDLVDVDSIQKAADEALHNDARLRFVATEANALAKATGQRRVLAAAAKAFASDMISRVKVRDLTPSRYQMAENRAAAAAAKAAAKGDLVSAATEKRNQVVNAYATRAAMDAKEEVGKTLRFLGRFNSDGTRKGLDPEYRDQIDQLLDRFDLSKNTTLKALDRRKSLLAWYERMKAQDQEPMIPEELLNEANRKSYKDMTMEELRGLRDTVAQIAHLARLKNRLLAAKDARDFADTVEASVQEIEASAIGKPRNLTESNQIADKVEAGARGFAVMHRKFDSLITRLAGFVDKRDPGHASTLWKVMVRPKNEAADREQTRLTASTKELQRIFKLLAEDRVRQKVFIPEINNSLSLEGRLAVLLNWGNEGNRQRVVDGDHWNEAQVAAIFKTLEPRHFQFAQELLDHVNSFRDEVAAAHKRRYGIEPPMVEPAPFTAVASDGSTVDMRGGYYPIKYDPNRSAKAADFDAMKEAKAAIVGSTRGYVKAGFMRERADAVENRPVSKSFSTAFQHVTEVIHDLAWGDYLIDAKRLMNSDTLANAIRVHAGPEILSSMKRAVQAMEVGDVPAQTAFEKAVQYVNSGTTLAGLGWNFIVSTKHPLGLFNGAARIGPQWIGVGLKRWIGDAAQMQNTVEWVHSKSEFMASRAHGRIVTRDLQDVSGKMSAGLTSDVAKIVAGPKAANAIHTASAAVERSFYWMIERGQMIADVPTWIGQYEKSMQAHGDDAMAVQQANQAVRDSQTTGGFTDLPEIQRGGPLMKLWTKFYSYFTVVYNQLAESAEETRFRGVSNVPALAGDVMLALIMPAIAGAAIQRMLPGGDQREEWAAYLGKHLMADLFGTMIGLRDVYAAFTEDKDAPGGMRLLKNTADLGKQTEQGHTNTPAFWKALNAEGGVLFHYPSATVQRFVTGIQALADGETHNPLVVATGPHPKQRR